jgi:MFS transporter, PPP family, 3-phenylpropionic acid transporter
MKRSWPFAFYLFYFAAAVFIQPNFVVYLQKLNFSGAQIGMLSGIIPLIIMLGAPLWTGLADATSHHKPIMILTILVAALAASIFPLVSSLTGIIPLVIVYALFAAPVIPFADSATMAMLAEDKEMYGRVRLGGTIGWGAVALLAGPIIDSYGIHWAFWCYAAIMMITLIVSLKFSYPTKKKQESWAKSISVVLRDKRWGIFLSLAFVAGIAFAVINSYLFPYMDELNINNKIRYFAITISTISELPLLFFANRLLRRFKPLGLLKIAMAITGLRLLLYSAFNFQAGILAFQFLNAMTFPLFLVAGVAYANEISPEGIKSTGQGLFGAMVAGFGSAVGNLAGGLLLGSIGGRGLYLAAGIFVVASLVVILLINRYQQTRALGSLR